MPPATVNGWYWDDASGLNTSNPVMATLDITPFDATQGTLNSVTLFAEVNASGSLQAWYYGLLSADLSYSLSNTLTVTEMGDTVVSDAGIVPMPIGDPDYGQLYFGFANANNYTITTLTSGFGRFLTGPDPFPVSPDTDRFSIIVKPF